MKWVFQEPLDDAAALLTEQLELVKEKGYSVQVHMQKNPANT
jgi:hypothetical protein